MVTKKLKNNTHTSYSTYSYMRLTVRIPYPFLPFYVLLFISSKLLIYSGTFLSNKILWTIWNIWFNSVITVQHTYCNLSSYTIFVVAPRCSQYMLCSSSRVCCIGVHSGTCHQSLLCIWTFWTLHTSVIQACPLSWNVSASSVV